jgi:HAD superfamily hydrolase (TIGR01509 family)
MSFTVFWDNDGVLVDTETLYFQSSREILARVGVTLTRECFVDHSLTRGLGLFDLVDETAGADREQLRRQRNQRYGQLLEAGTHLIDGVEETLEILHERVQMSVVTGSRRDHFEIIHRSSGLLKYFQFVLTREDYERAKPHPDAYRAALARAQLTAAECVVVEDSARGVAAAVAAGLRCIVVPNELTLGAKFDGAYRVLDSIRAVPDAVRELAGV